MTNLLSLLAGSVAVMAIGAGQGAGKAPEPPFTLDEMMAQATLHFEVLDTDKDGFLSEADKPTKASRFATLDTDGSGTLTQDEITQTALARFDEYDANGDGVIDEDERPERVRRFARRMEEKGSPSREKLEAKVSGHFDRIDTDGNGEVTLEEFEAADHGEGRGPGRRFGRKGGGDGPRGFMRADANGDGKVSLDEHLARVEENFARLDADGDGIVTEAELKANFQSKRKAPRPE